MKHGPSLQQERDALLEHIHASRAAYRRMLTDINAAEQQKTENEIRHLAPPQAEFPRSMTMRWIVKHPWLTTFAVAGVTALLVAGPRRTVRIVKERSLALKQTRAARVTGPALGALTAVATAALRSPARMQLAVRAFSAASEFLKRRRRQSRSAAAADAARHRVVGR